MGIKSFHRWYKWVCTPPKQVDWSNWSNQSVGVDILGFLYNAKQSGRSLPEEIAQLILLLKRHQIQPIFVFDGKTPADKQSTCSARRRQKEFLPDAEREASSILTDERNTVKQLLYASGCLSINASGEADSVLAYLMRQGRISAILSTDMDFLARGCKHLLVPYKSSWQHYSLETILQESKLSADQFVSLCLLLGTDYNPSIPTLSYQKIYWSLMYGTMTLDTILQKEGIRNTHLWHKAERILCGADDTWSSLVSERQQEKWSAGAPAPEPLFCALLLPHWQTTDLEVLTEPNPLLPKRV